MATYTASSNCGIRPYRSIHGSPQIKYFELSTAATPLKAGEIVQFDTVAATNGHRVCRIQTTGGTGANLVSILADRAVGVCAESDTSDGSTSGIGTKKIGVFVFSAYNQETEFMAYTRNSGAITSSCIGQNRSMIYDSTLKIFQVDSSNSTTALQTVTITGIPYDGPAAGDTGAPVLFKFFSSIVSVLV